MSANHAVQPGFTVLRPDQMEQVHEYSLRILEDTGVRVDSERARQIFASSVGEKQVNGDRIHIPRELVEQAIETAPSVIDIYNRRGELAFRLGRDRTRFGIGVTVLYYQNPEDDSLEEFTRKHMETTVRLGHTLPNYDLVSTVGVIHDEPPEVADLYATLEMAANTTKPLVILISEERLFPDALDMLEHLAGDLRSKPWVMPYFNPVTPLVINEGTADKMLEAIDRGLPLIYSNYSMAGMSSPMTPAGNLALLNAELLAGLVLSQLAKEGAPIILGSLPNYFDMKTMVSFYDPHSILMSQSSAEMMHHYKLPHCGTSGGAMGWGADLMAAGTYWMNTLTSLAGKSGMAPFVGDMLRAKAFSPASVVYIHDVISQVLRFAEGFPLDDASTALNEINQVGPGGNFLMVPQTLKHYKNGYFNSEIFPRWSMESWLAKGRPQADTVLREYTKRILDNLDVPADHDELMAKGEAFIKRRAGGR